MSWSAVWDAPRPFLHPVRTPAGAVLTVDAPADHPWHHALWFAIKFVNGENFWEEYDEFGTLHARNVVALEGDGMRATIDWVRPDGETIALTETRTLTSIALGDDAYAIDWRESLVPAADVELDRTPFTTWGGYGGLTLRGSREWHDTELVLADGSRHDRLLGEPSRWCALRGLAPYPDGRHRECGVVIADHPANQRSPTPWYASNRADTYGEGWANFLNAAFLWNEPLAVPAASRLDLRYLVIVHDGPLPAASIERTVSDWIAQ